MRLSYLHRGGDTPLIGTTIDPFLRDVASRHLQREALVSVAQDIRLTYAQLDRAVDRMARGLMGLGITRGDRVGIWSSANAQWLILQLAAARVGAILVAVNPAYRAAELRHALRLARVQALFLIPSFRSSRYVEMLCEICPRLTRVDAETFAREPCAGLPELRRLVVYDPDHAAETARPAPAFLTWSEVINGGRAVTTDRLRARSASLDADDPVNIQFTSGTTGCPKAVLLTHHSILNNGFFIGEAMGLTADDRLCVPVPFYHCFGMVVANLACLTHGAAIVIPAPHFDAGATLATIEAERCTAVYGVPTMFIAQLDHPDFGRYDLSSLRTGIMGGAPCPPELMTRVMDDMGCRDILIAYGQTETSPVTHLTRLGDPLPKRIGTVGTNLPHQEVKIVDPTTGVTLPLGRPGEICFRGYHVMRGYYGQDDATAEVLDRAGWLHSGDLGVLDADGCLSITGRLKEMIIRGGENIYPAEIEAFYHEHPDVAEVAVFGVPDEKMGEEVGAWIRLREGAELGVDDLLDFARARIAHFKIPRHLWIVDEFPMTATGKIRKFRIRAIVKQWMREEATATY